MKLSQMVKAFAKEFGTPVDKIDSWQDDEGNWAIEPMADFVVKQYQPKKGTWVVGFRSKSKKDNGKRTLVGPYDIKMLPKIALALYALEVEL